jgi:ribosomal protein S12 methylthiotransferase
MTFYIENLGCAKNQVDAEYIIASLTRAGHEHVTAPADAELIIVNSCGFIDSAKEESIDTTLALRAAYPGARLVMTGCLAERYAEELAAEMTEVDLVIGNARPESFAEQLDALGESAPRKAAPGPSLRRFAAGVSATGVSAAAAADALRRREFLSYPGSAFLKIAEGCSNHCSYCAIPLIRGELESRTRPRILAEIEQLLGAGIREINLIAQDLASYGLDRGRGELEELLDEISRLQGDFWVRLLYLHPDRFPAALPERMIADPRILPYFDLPFQHASPRLLQSMGRRGGAESYLELITGIRRQLPQAVIRSTFLVGFPGETEADFDTLLDFQRAAELDWLGVFDYSREEGTPAYDYAGQVPAALAGERRRKIEEAQIPITHRRLDRYRDRRLELLVEEHVQGEDLYLARGYLHAPDVDGLVVLRARGLSPGQKVAARILRRNGVDLEAVLPERG